MLSMKEEALIIEHGRMWKGVKSFTTKPEAWTKEVNTLLNERNLKIRNEKPRLKFTKNNYNGRGSEVCKDERNK